MTSIANYLSEVYSEDLYSISESDYDEVVAAPSTLYIDPKDGTVRQIPEPKSLGRIGGVEI